MKLQAIRTAVVAIWVALMMNISDEVVDLVKDGLLTDLIKALFATIT